MVIDISERKQAEAELIQAKEAWERTFNAVPDLIMILDNEYQIIRANKAVTDKLGCTEEELVGLSCFKAVSGTEEPPQYCPNVRLLADGLEHSAEVHENHLGGDFLVPVSPPRNVDGTLIGSVHVARDITERRQMEEALRKSRDELERRVEERTAD